ncbi:MAG: TonB-dependent receptor [Bacteroidota bacterium]
MKRCAVLSAAVLLLSQMLPAGTTGKIAGWVRDAENGEPLVGASVMIEGTAMGASTDINGNYTIISVPPGTYTVTASGVGYQKKRFLNVKVSVDFTTRLDVTLPTDVIALETIVVEAEVPMIRRDLTSSQTTVDAASIEALPVESITQILTLQAGIVQGAGGELHIRGGRSTEIAYTVNGVSISNPFDNTRVVNIATNAVQELSVVSGTFNAEYGNALSGVVNTITKEGGPTYRLSLSSYTGDYLSTRTNPFSHIDDVDPFSSWVTEGTASGPLPGMGDMLTLFLSGRYEESKGWLYGIREHNPEDYVLRNPIDPNSMTIISTGDSALVAMNPSKSFSATAKLSFSPIPTLKIRYDVLFSNGRSKGYNHDYKYNPDGTVTSYEWGLLNSLEVRHALDPNTYYTVRGSWNLNDFRQYLYPLLDGNGKAVTYSAADDDARMAALHADPRYQPDFKLNRAAAYTFLSGGTQNGHYYQRSRTLGAKADITSQVDQHHEVRAGIEYRDHQLFYDSFEVLRDTVRYFTPTIPAVSTPYRDRYVKYPKELSAYLQDKMEYESIVLNVGLRYDYFTPKSAYSTNVFYPSPSSPTIPPQIDKSSLLAPAAGKHQWSPRIGISFPITDRGILHFSYGHFFQMPPFQYMYANPGFKYNFATGTQVFGNPNLNPEKTITYEIGLQQQFTDKIAMNVTGFYKDVRDLLALQQIRVSGEETYLMYVNKDYANIRGITLSLSKRRTAGDMLGLTLDYTFQTSEGNDVNTDAFFLDLSSGRQSEKIPVYLDWDQTHTLNMTASVGEPNDWNLSIVGRLGSGLPFTPQLVNRTIYLRRNSGRRPARATVDLLADKTYDIGLVNLTLFLKVFNLLDVLNERFVYNDTGRATYTLVQNQGPAVETDKIAARVSGVHSSDDYFQRPQYYYPPREVRVGVSIEY